MNQNKLWIATMGMFLAVSFASAQTYISIDVPGAGVGAGQGTFPQNVSDSGLVFGNYVDPSGVAHGFIRSTDGDYTTFDVSGAGIAAGQGTMPVNRNFFGTMTGAYIDAKNVSHGFIRTVPARGQIQTVSVQTIPFRALTTTPMVCRTGIYVFPMAVSRSSTFPARVRPQARVRCRKSSTCVG